MEQAVVEELQNLRLTKEENEEIQITLWGLPFELMSKEIGQDIGRSLGRLIKVDRRACQADKAKFMRIRVNIPIDKPLLRGGNVAPIDQQCTSKQYGEWLRANGSFRGNVNFKGGNARQKFFSSSNQNDETDGRGNRESGVAMGWSSFSPAHHVEGSNDDGSFQNSNTSNKPTQRQDGGVTDTHMC
nr:hypothetical protein CFP56_16162 [Quercus suber]